MRNVFKTLVLGVSFALVSFAAKALPPNGVFVGCSMGEAFLLTTDAYGNVSGFLHASTSYCNGGDWYVQLARVSPNLPFEPDAGTEQIVNTAGEAEASTVSDELVQRLDADYEADKIGTSYVNPAHLTSRVRNFLHW